MRARSIAVLLVVGSCSCAGRRAPAMLPAPGASSDGGTRSASVTEPSRNADAAGTVQDAGVESDDASTPDHSGPPHIAEVVPTPDDPLVGLTEADVRRVVARAHPTVHLNGDATLTIRGRTWTIEFEPGNCSYWTAKLELVFEKGRVARVTRARGRSTGKICDW